MPSKPLIETYLERSRKHIGADHVAIGALSIIAVWGVFVRYLHVVRGNHPLFYDARIVWQPLATRVLDGAVLYGEVGDNKPPLFQYLNILVGATGHYATVFYVLVAIANAVGASLLYLWVSKYFTRKHGLLSAFLFITALPLVSGTIINVRSFAVIGVLAALLTTGPFRTGVALTVAGMFSQYVAFAVPVIVYDAYTRLDSNRDALKWITWFGSGCILILSLTYGSVIVFWGAEAFEGAIRNTVTRSSYFVLDRPSYNLWRDPTGWAASMARSTTRILFVVVPGALGLIFHRDLAVRPSNRRIVWLCVWLSVAYSGAFLVKASSYYWVLPLPFLATLAAILLLSGIE